MTYIHFIPYIYIYFLSFFYFLDFNFSLNIFLPINLYFLSFSVLITESTKQYYKNNNSTLSSRFFSYREIEEKNLYRSNLIWGGDSCSESAASFPRLSFPPSSLNLSSILFLYLFIYFLYPFSFSFCLFPSPLSPSPHMSFPLEDTRCTGSYLRITLRVVDCALNRKQKPAAKGNRFTKGGGKRGEGRRGERERRKKPIANNQVNARAYSKIINRTFLIPPRNSMGYWSNFFQPTAHGLVCPPPPKRVHLVARFTNGQLRSQWIAFVTDLDGRSSIDILLSSPSPSLLFDRNFYQHAYIRV